MTDPMRLAQDERSDLADLLAGLAPEQWNGPTLCTKWRVRDVVAHLISYDDLGPLGLVGRFAQGWFTPDQVNEVGVQRYAGLSTDELLAELENRLRPAGIRTPGAPPDSYTRFLRRRTHVFRGLAEAFRRPPRRPDGPGGVRSGAGNAEGHPENGSLGALVGVRAGFVSRS